MRVGILGAGGQIGGAAVRRLAENGDYDTVAVFRNIVSAAPFRNLQRCEVRVSSNLGVQELMDIFVDCDVILNCALASGTPRVARSANLTILENLAASARRNSRWQALVHLSSVAVYGTCIEEGASFERPRPQSAYGREKLYLEERTRRAFSGLDANLFVIRVGHVYGPYQTHSRNFLQLADSGDFALPFAGLMPSNAIHVDRLVLALANVTRARLQPGTYNATNEPNAPWLEIFRWHTELTHRTPVRLLDEAESRSQLISVLQQLRRPRAIRLMSQIMRELVQSAGRTLLTSPELRDLGTDVLLALPGSVEQAVKRKFSLWSARRQISQLPAKDRSIDPYFFSIGVPGPNALAASPATGLTPLASADDFRRWVEEMSWPA